MESKKNFNRVGYSAKQMTLALAGLAKTAELSVASFNAFVAAKNNFKKVRGNYHS